MFKTTLTLSEPMAKTLRLYPVKPKGNMHAQSQVVEEAFIEFFKRHRITVENLTTVKKISPDEAKNKIVLIIKDVYLKYSKINVFVYSMTLYVIICQEGSNIYDTICNGGENGIR